MEERERGRKSKERAKWGRVWRVRRYSGLELIGRAVEDWDWDWERRGAGLKREGLGGREGDVVGEGGRQIGAFFSAGLLRAFRLGLRRCWSSRPGLPCISFGLLFRDVGLGGAPSDVYVSYICLRYDMEGA